MPVAIKFKKTYNKIFKSAKNKADNDAINLVDALIDRTREEGSVGSSDENIDLNFKEGLVLNHKGFFIQSFEIGQLYKAFAGTDTVKHNVRFESDLQTTERKAIQQVIGYVDQFRQSKPNDNRIIRV